MMGGAGHEETLRRELTRHQESPAPVSARILLSSKPPF